MICADYRFSLVLWVPPLKGFGLCKEDTFVNSGLVRPLGFIANFLVKVYCFQTVSRLYQKTSYPFPALSISPPPPPSLRLANLHSTKKYVSVDADVSNMWSIWRCDGAMQIALWKCRCTEVSADVARRCPSAHGTSWIVAIEVCRPHQRSICASQHNIATYQL